MFVTNIFHSWAFFGKNNKYKRFAMTHIGSCISHEIFLCMNKRWFTVYQLIYHNCTN